MHLPLRMLLLCLTPLLALAGDARAQLGTPPPEFTPAKWINSPPLTLEALRGKALRIEIFRTWSEECATAVPSLSAKFDKEQKDGVVVIGVSSETPETIAAWVRRLAPSYPVLALKGEEFERALGSQAGVFPVSAVVDPAGTLTYSSALAQGSAATALDAAAATATKGALWPRKLDKAHAALRECAVAKAWVELNKLDAAKFAEGERTAAEQLAAFLESAARDALDEVRKLLEVGRVFESHGQLAPYAKATPALAIADDARKLLAEIEALAGYKDEMRVGPAFVAALELELRQELRRAVNEYRELARKFPKLRVAAAVAARLELLKRNGMLVYDRDCAECAAAGKACPRHVESP